MKAAQPIPKLKPDSIVRVRFDGGYKSSVTDMRFNLYLWFREHKAQGMRIIEKTDTPPDRDWTYEAPIRVNSNGKQIAKP